MKALRHRILAAVVAAILAAPVRAAEEQPSAGIRTDFGDIQIDNLGIGRTYTLRELAGVPLKITNSGTETINLLITVEVPDDTMITPIRKRLGYRPVPSVDWVTLGQTQFIVPAGESAFTDVVIKIPDDPSLYGKKFQASIYSRTTGAAFLNLGVWSHLQFGITESPEKQAQIEKNRKRGFDQQVDYSLMPDKLIVEKAPIGRKFEVRKELRRSIMIANVGADPIQLAVNMVRIPDSPLTLQSGFEEGKLEWLTVKTTTVTVPGAAFADTGLTMNLPNDRSLAGKKLMWVLEVKPIGEHVVGVTYYGKIYVEVEE
jgi:hypothetical protein